jgi:hypothetical protein
MKVNISGVPAACPPRCRWPRCDRAAAVQGVSLRLRNLSLRLRNLSLRLRNLSLRLRILSVHLQLLLLQLVHGLQPHTAAATYIILYTA